MIISELKLADMRMLKTLLQCAEIEHSIGKTEIAAETLEVAELYRKRIKNHKYD